MTEIQAIEGDQKDALLRRTNIKKIVGVNLTVTSRNLGICSRFEDLI